MTSEEHIAETARLSEESEFAAVFRTGLDKSQVDFLEAFLVHASIRKAAAELEIDRKRHYEWMRSALYFRCFQEAQRQVSVALESEATRRAVDGVLEPIYDKEGKLKGHKRRFSDSLLLELLKANNPEKFKVPEKKPNGGGRPPVVVYLPNNRRETPEDGSAADVVKMPEKHGTLPIDPIQK